MEKCVPCGLSFTMPEICYLLPIFKKRKWRADFFLFIFTVLDQSFSEMRFHVRSLVQNSHICGVWVWKVYFAAIDVKFCDQGTETCLLPPVLSNNLKIFSLFFPCTVQPWLSFPGVKLSCQIFMHFIFSSYITLCTKWKPL